MKNMLFLKLRIYLVNSTTQPLDIFSNGLFSSAALFQDMGRANPQQPYHMTNHLGEHTNVKLTIIEKDLGVNVDTN